MKVLFIRTVPPDKEPRLIAIMNFVKKLGHNVELLLWDRTGEYYHLKEWQGFPIHAIHVPAQFGKGLKSLKSRMQFIKKAIAFLKDNSFDIVHGCDLDGVLPAVFVGNRQFRVYYDVFDFIYLYKSYGISFIRKALELLEHWVYKQVDAVILPDENRRELIPQKFASKIAVVPNVPEWTPEEPDHSILACLPDKKVKIYYAGVLYPDRGIQMLLELGTRRHDVGIVIAGSGILENMVRQYAEKHNNIVFLGKLPLPVAQGLYKHITHVWCVYDPSNPINRLSSPNKLFEAILSERIPIVAKGTYWDEYVKMHNAGIVIDYVRGLEQLEDFDFKQTLPVFQKQITRMQLLIKERKQMFVDMLKKLYL